MSSTYADSATSYHSINIYPQDYDYPDQLKDTWPYRTDDKYSLFYYHPPKHDDDNDPEDAEDPVYEYEYDTRPAQDNQNLNAPQIGQTLPPLGLGTHR